jgi:hypothetical protein
MQTTEEEIRAAADQLRGTVEERRRKTQWTRGVIRALIVVCVFFIFQQITGINIPFYYGPKILATFFQSSHDAVAAAVAGVEVTAILGAVNVVATYFAFRWIDKFGRRPLAMGVTRAWRCSCWSRRPESRSSPTYRRPWWSWSASRSSSPRSRSVSAGRAG